MKTYYLCDLAAKRVISGGLLPDTFGNINCLLGLTDQHLADLSQFGSQDLGFLSYADAQAAGMEAMSLKAAHDTVIKLAWRPIEGERNEREAGGFFADGYWFHSDESSRTKYSTFITVALENNLPGDYVLREGWKTMTGEFVTMTVARVRAIRDAGIVLSGALFDSGQYHRLNMEASADPFGYDFSTGWPTRYGED